MLEEFDDFTGEDSELIQTLGEEYTLLGKPIPLARPRHNTTTNRTYDSQLPEKNSAILQLKSQHISKKPYTSKLKIMIIFFFEIPKSKRKTISIGSYHLSKPDIDNLCKFTLDVLVDSQIIKTDALVSHLTACKVYSEDPCTKIFIREL